MDEIFKDANGVLRAHFRDPYQMLGWFLERDVQGSQHLAEEVLASCEKVRSGLTPEWGITGNAHTVTVRGHDVIIEADFDPSSSECKLPLTIFVDAVRSWRDQLASQ